MESRTTTTRLIGLGKSRYAEDLLRERTGQSFRVSSVVGSRGPLASKDAPVAAIGFCVPDLRIWDFGLTASHRSAKAVPNLAANSM